MKTLVASVALSIAAALPSSAQVFRPETVSGAVLGGIAGAVIGNNSGDLHHNAWRGAAIGTVAGGIIGSMTGQARERAVYAPTQVPVAQGGYAYAPRSTEYVYAAPSQGYVTSRPNYAATGTLLGGLAGAIIGHNDGRHGWEGAAYGAGAGLLLGAIAENSARAREAAAEAPVPIYDNTAMPTSPAPAVQMAPAETAMPTASPAPAASSMSAANSMFGR